MMPPLRFDPDSGCHMSQSGDGGLYAELLQNRAFQLVTPGSATALNPWSAVNGAQISVVKDTVPVSSALPNSLNFVAPTGATGPVGLRNPGFWGIKVTSGSQYTASFFYRFPTSSSFNGPATISLQSSSGQVLGSTTVNLSGSQTSWKQVTVNITPRTTASSTNNTFVVTVDGRAAAGQTIRFALFSLFPPTFKDRPNGMRPDIAEALQEMGPKFFRFPGGNNLGEIPSQRWQWNNTVGPLQNRPGRLGDWGYINTDGLGLFEYLLWCEDLNMEAIMAIWSGFSLQGESIPPENLGPYIQQAADQINFVVGDPAKSASAALRASLGHPAPFKLTHVEVGNEEFFAADTYPGRWTAMVTALQAQFPNLRFMATSNVQDPPLTPTPVEWDLHVYQTPSWFFQNAFQYDDFERNGTKYFEGEYAAISLNSSDIFGTPATGRLLFPTMQSASGEACFMTGLERNSDIVFAAAYAPLLNHVNNSQWTPNLVSFDAANVYRSTSFHVQKLFSRNRGDSYLPSTLPSRNDSLHWSVARSGSTGVIIKVANGGIEARSLTFQLPFNNVATSGTLQLLAGAQNVSNSPATPNAVAPKNSTIAIGKTFEYQAPAFSVGVITFSAS
ncbi:hypothetical protein PM082_012603 [Marasmius tenuissimus]|nr:hypothetical protein PM082_012603 [Marasmius tenuissimus]